MAYLRGQAVDGVTIGKSAIDDCATRRNRAADTVSQLDTRAINDGEQVLQSQRFLGDRDGAHGTPLNQRY